MIGINHWIVIVMVWVVLFLALAAIEKKKL